MTFLHENLAGDNFGWICAGEAIIKTLKISLKKTENTGLTELQAKNPCSPL